MESDLSWSRSFPLKRDSIKHIPKTPGVYEVCCMEAGGIIYIGSATGAEGLRQRLGARISQPKRNLSPFEKGLLGLGRSLTFRYVECDDAEQAKSWKNELLSDYFSRHGQLPPGNTLHTGR